MTNPFKTVLYIGVTSDLKRRVYQHKIKEHKGFTEEYNCNILVYYEVTNDIHVALEREKQLKKWSRSKKDNLIKDFNTEWKDLSTEWFDLT